MEDSFMVNLREILDNPLTDPDLIGWSENGFYCNSEKFIISLAMRRLCHSATKFGSFRKQLNLRGVYQVGKGSRNIKHFESRHEPKFCRNQVVKNDNILSSTGTTGPYRGNDFEVQSELQRSFTEVENGFEDEFLEMNDHRGNSSQNIPFDHFNNGTTKESHSLQLPDFSDFNDFHGNRDEIYQNQLPSAGLVNTMALATASTLEDNDAHRNNNIGKLRSELHVLQSEIEGIKKAVVKNGQVLQQSRSKRQKSESGGEPDSTTHKVSKLSHSEAGFTDKAGQTQTHITDLNVAYDYGTSSPSAERDDTESTSSKDLSSHSDKSGSEVSASALSIGSDEIAGIIEKLPTDSKDNFIDRLAYHVVKMNNKSKAKGDFSSNRDSDNASSNGDNAIMTTTTTTTTVSASKDVVRVYNKVEDVCPFYEVKSEEEKVSGCPLQILCDMTLGDPEVLPMSKSTRIAHAITHAFNRKPQHCVAFINIFKHVVACNPNSDAGIALKKVLGNLWSQEWDRLGDEEKHSMCLDKLIILSGMFPIFRKNLEIITAGRMLNKFSKEQEAVFPEGVLDMIDDAVKTFRLFEQEAAQ